MKLKYLILVLLSLVLASTQVFAQDQVLNPQSSDFADKWCRDVSAVIRTALYVGQQAPSYEDEEAVLQSAIAQALAISNEKHHRAFRYTLSTALEDANIYPDDLERRVEFLRRTMEEALRDLWYIDREHVKFDRGPYVDQLLNRSLEEGRRAPHSAEEFMLLLRAAQRGAQLLELSDFSRTSNYACAQTALLHGIELSEAPGLDMTTKIYIFRNALSSAVNLLYGSRPWCSN